MHSGVGVDISAEHSEVLLELVDDSQVGVEDSQVGVGVGQLSGAGGIGVGV